VDCAFGCGWYAIRHKGLYWFGQKILV